jgi:hypothetical protein
MTAPGCRHQAWTPSCKWLLAPRAEGIAYRTPYDGQALLINGPNSRIVWLRNRGQPTCHPSRDWRPQGCYLPQMSASGQGCRGEGCRGW